MFYKLIRAIQKVGHFVNALSHGLSQLAILSHTLTLGSTAVNEFRLNSICERCPDCVCLSK